MKLFYLSYETRHSKSKKENEPKSKAPPGAVFVEPPKLEPPKPKKKETKVPAHKIEVASLAAQLEKVTIANKKFEEKNSTTLDDQAKQARKLKKLLRQIQELEEKIKNNPSEKLEKEQLEKISKKQTIIDELNDLGEDINNI